jgi:hypothetical protein
MMKSEDEQKTMPTTRGEMGAQMGGQVGAQAGGQAGAAIGSAYGGPIGGMVGQYVGEKVGEQVGSYVGDQVEETVKEKAKGGGCGGGSGGAGSGQYSASDGACHKNPKTPLYKLEIEENKLPENWWDKLPDFDPRVYDAIAMEQAEACVNYIFQGLPDMHEVENQIQSNGFRKTCPRLKTQVPRTKVIKPKEVKQEVKIESFIKKDQTY